MAYRANPPPPLDLGLGSLFLPVATDQKTQDQFRIPPVSPRKLTCQDFNRWSHQLIGNRELRDILVGEMTGNFIGPMPADDFIDEFMRVDDHGPVPEVDFTDVPYDGIERDMYAPFVCPRMFFR